MVVSRAEVASSQMSSLGDRPVARAKTNEVRFKAEGFLARVLQHEIDHCNGKVFIDHIKDKTDAFYTLDEKGELQPLDYASEIAENSILWD